MNKTIEEKNLVKLRKENREKDRLQEVMQSEEFKLYSKFQRVEIAREFNQKCKKILELESMIRG